MKQLDSIQLYEEYLVNDGKAAKTVASYISDVRSFHEHLSQLGITDAARINRGHITGFRSILLKNGLKPATINKAVNSLASYTNFLISAGILPAQAPLVKPRQDRVKVATGSEHCVEVFTEEELGQLLTCAGDNLNQRDCLLVHFLLYTGCRVSELCNTRLSDLDLLIGQVKIIGKGDKYREVPLRPDLVEEIRRYVGSERAQGKYAGSDFLFVSQRAEKLDRDTVNKVLSKIQLSCGFRVYPHKFRHTFCTRLITAGVPLTTISRLAGHADVSTTSNFYVNTSRQDKIDAVNLL